MNRRAYHWHVDRLKWWAKHYPAKPVFSDVTDRTAFDAAMKTMPAGWKTIVYSLHSGTTEAVVFGPRFKMTLSLDAANAIKRIAMTRCEMDPDAAAGIAFHCDQDAASYRERTQRFGAWTDRRTVRDEMQRLRQAVRLSDTSQELIWLSAWKQWGEHPKTALWSDDRSPWDPSAVLFNIGGWADQVLKWIEEATPERGGRPEPIQARQLIRGIAATFTRFTGKQCTATPGTPFYEITREVLSSLQLPCKGPRKLIHAALTDPTGARDKVL